MCFASNRQTPIVNANRLSSNLCITNRNYDRGNVGCLASGSSDRSPICHIFFLLSFSLYARMRFMKATGYEKGLLESQREILGYRLLALRLVGRSIRCTYYQQDNASLSPFFRFVAFLRASHRRQESRVK